MLWISMDTWTLDVVVDVDDDDGHAQEETQAHVQWEMIVTSKVLKLYYYNTNI